MEGLRQLADESVHCVVTSPPYWGLRDYGIPGQIGLEPTPQAFVERLVEVFREVKRVMRADGTLWLNLGDTYTSGGRADYGSCAPDAKQATHMAIKSAKRAPQPPGLKPKDLVGIPWRVALALQADGWYLRSDIIWAKPNPMPESVTDRPTKSHEYVFLLTKAERYHYDAEAIKEPAVATHPSAMDGGPQRLRDGSNANNGRHYRKSDAAGLNGRNVQATNSEADRRDQIGGSFNNNPRFRPDNGRNKRSVWTIPTSPFPDAHFATFPPELPELCIKAGCPKGGTVLDPFSGAGTTALVADRLQRDAIGIELNPEYSALSSRRLDDDRGGLLDMMEAR